MFTRNLPYGGIHKVSVSLFYFIIIFWPVCAASGILVPRPEIKLKPSAVKAQSPKHWTAREFPLCHYFKLCLLGLEKRHSGTETKYIVRPNRSLFYFLSCYFHVRCVKFVFPSLLFSREKGAVWTPGWRTWQPLSPTQLPGLQRRANPMQTSWEVTSWNLQHCRLSQLISPTEISPA